MSSCPICGARGRQDKTVAGVPHFTGVNTHGCRRCRGGWMGAVGPAASVVMADQLSVACGAACKVGNFNYTCTKTAGHHGDHRAGARDKFGHDKLGRWRLRNEQDTGWADEQIRLPGTNPWTACGDDLDKLSVRYGINRTKYDKREGNKSIWESDALLRERILDVARG